jgi:hypothetical protein
MNDQPPQIGLLAKVSANETDGELVKIPVVRGANFVRLAPNTFTAWHVPGGDNETMFNIYLQAIESRETMQFLDTTDQGQPKIAKKETLLQATELAAMSLTVAQMKGLKEAVDSALAIWEQHERQKGPR